MHLKHQYLGQHCKFSSIERVAQWLNLVVFCLVVAVQLPVRANVMFFNCKFFLA